MNNLCSFFLFRSWLVDIKNRCSHEQNMNNTYSLSMAYFVVRDAVDDRFDINTERNQRKWSFSDSFSAFYHFFHRIVEYRFSQCIKELNWSVSSWFWSYWQWVGKERKQHHLLIEMLVVFWKTSITTLMFIHFLDNSGSHYNIFLTCRMIEVFEWMSEKRNGKSVNVSCERQQYHVCGAYDRNTL